MIRITAKNLNRANAIARELASIERTLDTPPDERNQVGVTVGEAGNFHVPVPWSMVQSVLEGKRSEFLHGLADLGIELLPPEPTEKGPR